MRETAQWVNQVQEPAASTRLGIPVTLSTDPRHAFTDHPGASFNSGACSAWPEPLGLAAIGDPALVERFGDTVRREYLAVGFRVALYPQSTGWGLLTDAPVLGELFLARAWGAEHLTVAERAAKALDAGSDQFGGEPCPEVIVELVRSGRVTEERIDESVRRLLREKFTRRLFENPYVDPDRAEETVKAGEFTALGEAAQRRSLTVLTHHGLLPLEGRPNLYGRGFSEQVAAAYGNVVADPVDADLAVLRLRTPSEERLGLFESFFHSGSLAFPEDELKEILRLLDAVPTLVCVNLERPAVLTGIAAKAAALVADYGASDTALLDVAIGRARAQGRLPFELPRSMGAVEASRPDVPGDTEDSVFPYGHGLNL
ncbi:glycoside hydrolase family 3 C-terminal domain-containing protein [Streptomyces sp. AK02-04a]|uniref:glycoside hydrolase family 3 C-terminal domain-containing protein n=1 Tax=Streptomyces sp. AK02-04a TaxID=3028649 RepID=UPI0029A4220B|nr:glycoside hydrolase family 3 C-terminal domain-containing protein [Streptomyces sp. AK02-04a]MDX3755519.1 glycoside hydrolase family 3 C-terminal domain-containing protein [Streptomyces sp. AK02-04a]